MKKNTIRNPPTNLWDAIQDPKVAESIKEIATGTSTYYQP
jgi:hypothetical protein